jgi:hypothetical protein
MPISSAYRSSSRVTGKTGAYYPEACNWLSLARQDVKERESSDDIRSRSDDSYSPRRHWCSI